MFSDLLIRPKSSTHLIGPEELLKWQGLIKTRFLLLLFRQHLEVQQSSDPIHLGRQSLPKELPVRQTKHG